MTAANNLNQIKHLYSRAAFGIDYVDLQKIKALPVRRAVDDLFEASAQYEALTLPGISSTDQPARPFSQLTADEKKMQLRNSRQKVRMLNTAWLHRMSGSPARLREKLTLFWHGHFACRSNNAAFLQQLNNIQRKNALGNFKSLLLEVSRSPAMLQFLNNQQNRKGKPNENFARELMELFTLGRGQYTETDIREAARAFTGWGYNSKGDFQFRPMLHDEGEKRFFGKTGNFDGTDIIDSILERPEAARFIARKLYVFLVSDSVDESKVKELGDHFYRSGYNISALVKEILTADWFYDSGVIGTKIKSPVELIVGINREFKVRYDNPEILIKFQGALGQVLFYPPNVAGWPGGKSWIDSSSLMIRLKLPSLLLNGGIIEFDEKSDIEDEALTSLMMIKKQVVQRQVMSSPDWNRFLKGLPGNLPLDDLAAFLLQPAVSSTFLKAVVSTQVTKSEVLELLSLPEYQMC
ncbi:DUF1800 domain-containing protein [Flavihumibacter sp. R14]|nr:DUF1800 domain-containing protein [Flavihumibacter soli]